MLWPLCSFFVVVAFTVALTIGEPRYRATAEVPLVLLAAVGLQAIVRYFRSIDDGNEPRNLTVRQLLAAHRPALESLNSVSSTSISSQGGFN